MKKMYIFTTALLMLAGTFTSCTKELDEVGMNATSIDAAKKEVGATNGSNTPRVEADINLSFSPTTQMIGNAVTITISFGTSAPKDGKLHLEQATGVDSEGKTIWTKVNEYPVTAGGVYTHEFTSNVAGTFEFRAHYIPNGNNGFSNTFKSGTVTFTADCVQGMTATVVEKELIGGNMYRLKVAFTLTTCEAYSNVHIQGGLTAKVSNVSVSENGNVRKHTNNDNYTIFWDETSLAKGTKTYYVTFEKEIKGAETVTGNWSAKTPDGFMVASTEGAYFDPAE
ncbi:hypothetical protein [Pontibacter amylolyticus]|uniref:Uncharacterized protein n=1 Tax=Pontibacter amylolyticus TaxID=1424080 RepID=A0ABQ1W005_9BACT|nr:hypothetical protein [Pontibacter amylolyticus]GGG06902.1 hypothetical protein GCM10011323_09480 [Pontibacter amylolyticus]